MWVYPLHIPNENQMSKVQPKSSLFFHSEACFSAAKAMREKKKSTFPIGKILNGKDKN
jgi:hypothetical protein